MAGATGLGAKKSLSFFFDHYCFSTIAHVFWLLEEMRMVPKKRVLEVDDVWSRKQNQHYAVLNEWKYL